MLVQLDRNYMSNNKQTIKLIKGPKGSLNMCRIMSKTSGMNVHINRLVHIFYISDVAKKVTLFNPTHILNTPNPQPHHFSPIAVRCYPVSHTFDTLSTSTTTTIFKLVIRKIMEQKNSSLTFSKLTIYN